MVQSEILTPDYHWNPYERISYLTPERRLVGFDNSVGEVQ